ncbi:MAG: gamma carbonic anhydrase family protein [Candidatus Lokiarchaeota archaeon]|nr:gamma carbonic anhydrase family protein [Candidatus Lokiarchaeota archaeon]
MSLTPLIMESPVNGKKPQIHESVFIAPTATIIGDVVIGKGSNIWFGAVLRGDWCKIVIGKNTSIQENVTVHSERNTTVIIGSDCIVGHHAMVHGPCVVEDGCLVGIGSNLLHNSLLGKGSLLAAGAVLVNKQIPPRSLVVGVPAEIKKKFPDESPLKGEETSGEYVENGIFFKKYFEK